MKYEAWLLLCCLFILQQFRCVLGGDEKVVTETTTKKVDVADTKEPAAAVNDQFHLVLHRAEKVDVSASKSTPSDADTFTTVHIFLQSPKSQYLARTCSIAKGTPLSEVCLDEVGQTWHDLDTARALIARRNSVPDLDLASYANLICPTSETWLSFMDCYCTKCDAELVEIPDEAQWFAIWKTSSFCQLYENNQNLCSWREFVRQSKTVDIDGMFRTAWNTEVKLQGGYVVKVEETEITRVHAKKESVLKAAAEGVAAKNGSAHDQAAKKDVNEDKKLQDIEKKKKEEELRKLEKEEEELQAELSRRLLDMSNVSNYVSMHSLVFLWTIVLASVVTILSFFILLR